MQKVIKCGRILCLCKEEITKLQHVVPINKDQKEVISKQLCQKQKRYRLCFYTHTMIENFLRR